MKFKQVSVVAVIVVLLIVGMPLLAFARGGWRACKIHF